MEFSCSAHIVVMNVLTVNKTVLGSRIAKAHAQAGRPTFNRLLHSYGGRPRCSGCKDLFSSWDRLRKHIEHGACQFPVSDSGLTHKAGDQAKERTASKR